MDGMQLSRNLISLQVSTTNYLLMCIDTHFTQGRNEGAGICSVLSWPDKLVI